MGRRRFDHLFRVGTRPGKLVDVVKELRMDFCRRISIFGPSDELVARIPNYPYVAYEPLVLRLNSPGTV